MKKYMCFLYLLFLPVFCYATDYYTGRDSVGVYRTRSLKMGGESYSIVLENKANSLIGTAPHDIVTGEIYTIDNRPYIQVDYVSLMTLAESIFTQDEIEQFFTSPNFISITLALAPTTGAVMEVKFYLLCRYNDMTMLSIPEDKIEALEAGIKANIVCSIPEAYSNASFLITVCDLFRE